MSSVSIVRREVDGELLVLDLGTQRIHRLNATANLICRLHEEGRSPAAIADVLTAEYEIEQEDALEDVERTLAGLADIGLFTPPMRTRSHLVGDVKSRAEAGLL